MAKKSQESSPEVANEFGDENDDFVDEGRCVALSLALRLNLREDRKVIQHP